MQILPKIAMMVVKKKKLKHLKKNKRVGFVLLIYKLSFRATEGEVMSAANPHRLSFQTVGARYASSK